MRMCHVPLTVAKGEEATRYPAYSSVEKAEGKIEDLDDDVDEARHRTKRLQTVVTACDLTSWESYDKQDLKAGTQPW